VIPRYSRPEMAGIWEERERLQRMLEVEIAVCEELAARGEIPKEAVDEIKAKAAFDPARVRELERTIKHDVIAFLTNVAENVGPASRFIHLGLTSSDALDTALALQLVQAADIILADIARLRAVLKRRALEHKRTLMAGRTHGMHAEPTTLGLKIAVWHAEFGRAEERMRRAREAVRGGKIKPYRVKTPVTFEVDFKRTSPAHLGTLFPGVERRGPRTIAITQQDYVTGLQLLWGMLIIAIAVSEGIL